jgi:hypoxanthine phosphoribosyltransferase
MKSAPIKAALLPRRAVPRVWRRQIAGVLLTPQQIEARVRRLARAIERDYAGRDLVLVALLKGTVVFVADLMRHLSLPLRLEFLGVSSYGHGTKPGRLTLARGRRLEVRGRSVLVIEDILDTGRTLRRVIKELRALGPESVRICVLLDKKARRQVEVCADYVGFQIPDCFVVGYGLDLAERYRNLPFVGVLKPTWAACPPSVLSRHPWFTSPVQSAGLPAQPAVRPASWKAESMPSAMRCTVKCSRTAFWPAWPRA